jgi:hypothetical protein
MSPAELPRTNPFSTRHVRPGALDFVFPSGVSAADVVARLERSDWRGAIVGAHGSGKSTLLVALVPEIERTGRRVISFALHDGQRTLPAKLSELPHDLPTLIIVDGYEQLSHWSRWRLDRFIRRRHWGLLVTSHTPVGLPTIYQTGTTLELARQIVTQLVPADDTSVTADDVAEPFSLHRGDMREALFTLYDLYEARRIKPQRGTGTESWDTK